MLFLQFSYFLATLQGFEFGSFVTVPFVAFSFSLVQFCETFAGTDSELSEVYAGRESQRRLLRQSIAGNSNRPLKIAAINGKHKSHRYLSKECKWPSC